jgi:hypothetical protein
MKLTSNKVKAQYLTVTLCENDTYTMGAKVLNEDL